MYKKFAIFYDKVYGDDFYNRYAFFIRKLIKENKINKAQILDLACGTGRLIEKLKTTFPNIEGADLSPEMLKIAKKRNKKIIYYNQSFLNLNIPKKYSVITSTFDSVNYLVDKKDLAAAFKNVAKHLLSKGIFIFDFNTVHKKIKREFKKDNVTYKNTIKNKYWFLTLNIKNNGKTYKEKHKERLYSLREVKSALEKNNLRIVFAYSDFNTKIKSASKYPRIFLVAKKDTIFINDKNRISNKSFGSNNVFDSKISYN